MTKVGPMSRIHESSSGASTISISSESWARARVVSVGSTTMMTFSNCATVLATSLHAAYAVSASAALSARVVLVRGNAIHTRSWGAVSAGIVQDISEPFVIDRAINN